MLQLCRRPTSGVSIAHMSHDRTAVMLVETTLQNLKKEILQCDVASIFLLRQYQV